jgi:hypothetical protein
VVTNENGLAGESDQLQGLPIYRLAAANLMRLSATKEPVQFLVRLERSPRAITMIGAPVFPRRALRHFADHQLLKHKPDERQSVDLVMVAAVVKREQGSRQAPRTASYESYAAPF